MSSGSLPGRFVFLVILLHPVCGVTADVIPSVAGEPARIVLIIDDLGHRKYDGLRAAALPGPVACAVLPHTPFGRIIAERAHDAGKEVILHLPLAPIEHAALAAGTIYVDTTRAQLARIFTLDIESVPHVVGVSSHMGSLLTQHPGHMTWLMDEIGKREGLFFVDSVTSDSSVALRIAAERGIPATRRDIFLDNVQTEQAIAAAFGALKDKARRRGVAIGIGHPYPVTMDFLERTLPGLVDEGVELISVADAIRYRVERVNGASAAH